MFYFLRVIYTLIETLGDYNRHSILNSVISTTNTVQFMTAELYGLTDRSRWEKIKNKNIEIEVQMWHKGKMEFKDVKCAADGNFFYTTPNKGKYYCLFFVRNADQDKYGALGLKTSVFSGEASLPVIRSTGEVELDKAMSFLKKVLDYARQNLTFQEVDFEDEESYKGIYDGILKYAVFMMVLKLAATIFTSYYSSIKTKQFFKSQHLAGEK